MKIGVMTGIKELDIELQNKIKQVTVAYYPKYFFENSDIAIAVVSPVQDIDMPFNDFLYELRKRNIRVIILLDNENSSYISSALSLGITDIIFDPITIEKIINKLQYPTPFSDVAKYYIENSRYSNHYSNKEDSTIKILKAQIIGLFDFFNKPVNKKLSINELMALLESEIIKKNI